MKRLHIHLSVDNIAKNVEFYSTMFDSEPTLVHDDYAKWMLDDPLVNFAISNRNAKTGLDHLGIQAENDQELKAIKHQLDATQSDIVKQEGTSCCYAESDKYWITDPQGIAWESFHSLKEIPTFNDPNQAAEESKPSSCCTPDINSSSSSCCG